MIRITFELLPGGNETRRRTIGIMEVANINQNLDGTADYAVALKKTPPFAGALDLAWKKGKVTHDADKYLNGVLASEDDELLTALVTGHHRTRRGVYDLLFRALKACGLDKRNP